MQSTAGADHVQDSAAEPGTADSDTDRARALEWAAAARVVRHRVRDDLSAGRTTLVEVLQQAHVDPLVGQVKLRWVLESVPGARKVDTRRALGAIGVDEGTRLAALDAATTARLLEVFAPAGSEQGSAGPSVEDGR
jgi:hypothetical protein